MRIKEFWNKNKQKITPTLEFAKRCLQSVIEMRETPKAIDYVNLGFQIKENFEIAHNLNDPYTYFLNKNWHPINFDSLNVVIYNLIKSSLKSQIRPMVVKDSVVAFVAKIDDLKFGWVVYNDKIEQLYVDNDERYAKVLEKIFWDIYTSGHVVMGVHGTNNIYLNDDANDSCHSSTSNIYAQSIKEYLDHGVYRSILFYGPPGSGKSNLVRSICSQLNLRTIRINNLQNLSTANISNILECFNPDAICLEDIDNVDMTGMSEVLEKIESLNQKMVFATANQISRLDNTLLRPGRFDEVHEISHLDKSIIMELVGGDEDIYQVVREFPAAFIMEVMKRTRVKGKAYVLTHMDDLTDRLKNIEGCNYTIKK
ncbi:MAG TPA: AAA family ATPase [Paenisporosarcina sp.]|nr:AAA family ATPase [Paenisporosarcina sp.]